MKIYCYYTAAYEELVRDWFLPSLKDNFEVILNKETTRTKSVRYKEEGWYDITREKTDLIIQAIRDNLNDVIVFSDPDIQFFLKTEEYVQKLSKNHDLVFQSGSPDGELCTGFFALRCNRKTLRLWQDVRDRIGFEKGSDQDCLNSLLLTNRNFLVVKWLYQLMGYYFSKYGLNPYGIRWEYFPIEFFSGGSLTGKLWSHGMPLELPENIIMHHANWTNGLSNKIAQLEYVKTNVLMKKIKK